MTRAVVVKTLAIYGKIFFFFLCRTWESYGCKVIVNTADITTHQGCKKLIVESLAHGVVGGIFNLAVLLRDSIFENQSCDKFFEAFAPKVFATRYLDELSRVLCQRLHYFVVFSSASCGRGNAGQSNYGMANSIMERIMEKRVKDNLPGKAIQWVIQIKSYIFGLLFIFEYLFFIIPGSYWRSRSCCTNGRKQN